MLACNPLDKQIYTDWPPRGTEISQDMLRSDIPVFPFASRRQHKR